MVRFNLWHCAEADSQNAFVPCPLTIGQHLALISKGGLEDALVIRITQQTMGTDLGLGESKRRQT